MRAPERGEEEKYKKMSVTAAKERKMGRRAPGTRRSRVAPVAVFAVVFALAAQDAHSQSKNTKKSRPARFFQSAHKTDCPILSVSFACLLFLHPSNPKLPDLSLRTTNDRRPPFLRSRSLLGWVSVQKCFVGPHYKTPDYG